MKLPLLTVMSLSIMFQFAAAFMAIRLIRHSGVFVAWILLASGFILQGIRRTISLIHVLNGLMMGDMTVEVLGLAISMIMAFGIWKIRPLFDEISRSHKSLLDRKNILQEQTERLEAEMTVRLKAQEELYQKQCQLEEINLTLSQRVKEDVEELRAKDQIMIQQGRHAAMGEMINNIAHQWRQPLNALGLVVSNIKDAQRFNELDESYVDKATADANRLIQNMSTTINDFRNFFRSDKERVAFPAGKLIREAVVLVESSFTNVNIAIHQEVSAEVMLVGYPNEFSQVILNLLSNSRDAILLSEVASGYIEITLSEDEANGKGYITIIDNGGGIPAEAIDRIFDPYFSTKQMGTGIGLYMSKIIIERNMGGSLDAHNVQDGAMFRIFLPLASNEVSTREVQYFT
jgi:signal transduction histidine kinase